MVYEEADYGEYSGTKWGKIFEDDIADLEPESWYASWNANDANNPSITEFVQNKGLVLMPTETGFYRGDSPNSFNCRGSHGGGT